MSTIISTPVLETMARARARWAPPPLLTVSEFCDRELIVTTGPRAGTVWQTDFIPYQRGILDVFHEPGVEFAVVMGSAQWGKTAIALAVAAYHIAHDPCPILMVEPTVDPMAKELARDRLEPLIAATPILRSTVSPKRAKDTSNTILQKTFKGGSISIAGANSAASLAARSIRVLILDEASRYPAELVGEGATINVALKRTTAYRGRRRVLILSTPTVKGDAIDFWFNRGDQRRYYVPCPECGHMHAFEWRNVRWTDEDPETARLQCPACDHAIDDAERVAVLARGEWRAEAPARKDKRIVSFRIWEAYSPISSLREIVGNFLQAREAQKAGNRREMHTWQNTTLGEGVEPDSGEGVEPHALLSRLEVYDADVPTGACFLTMGIDTQDDRLEALVVGWGPGEEAWLIDRQRLTGQTSEPGPWLQLEELLARQYARAGAGRMAISVSCLDTAGHRTTEAYQFTLQQRRRARHRLHACIGRDGQRPIVSKPSPQTWGKEARPVELYTIGVDAAKDLIQTRLALEEPAAEDGARATGSGPGRVHLPAGDWVDEEFAEQLTSERLVTKYSKGIPVKVWKQIRPRNEMLDCFVLALAALRLARVDLTLIATRGPAPAAQPAPADRRLSRSKYLGG